MNNFITGSQAYGNAKEDSDVDLVLLVDEDTRRKLEELSDSGGYPIMYGSLNLVCCTSEQEFNAWKLATLRCQAEKNLTKEKAIDIHETTRTEMGVESEAASGVAAEPGMRMRKNDYA